MVGRAGDRVSGNEPVGDAGGNLGTAGRCLFVPWRTRKTDHGGRTVRSGGYSIRRGVAPPVEDHLSESASRPAESRRVHPSDVPACRNPRSGFAADARAAVDRLLDHPHVALAPYRLPPDSHPAGGAEPGQEFTQLAPVLRSPRESADRVYLAGPAALSLHAFPAQLAADHANRRGSLAQAGEIDLER